MIKNSRNTYNHSYRNQSNLRSSSSLAQKRNYNTFQEDPQKAVFLSGFRTNIPSHKWKEYREAIYQDLQKYYNVYIRKLDLPVNHRFGYLHTKTVEQAEFLLNLNNEYDAETGKTLSQLDLARYNPGKYNWRTKICVYEYERKNEGRHHMGSRNHSSERNLNVRGRSDRSFNNSNNSYNAGYDTPQSVRSHYKNYPGTRSRNDNSLSTNGFGSEDFSRSTSPSDKRAKLENNQFLADNQNLQNSQNYETLSNLDHTINKDSALQSHNVTEPGSEDENLENIENLMLKNRSKSTSTKTVVPVDNNKLKSLELDQQILNYENESDAEMNFSSDDGCDKEQNLNHVNFQQVAKQTTDKIIYEGLKQNWQDMYNCLSDHVQQKLMLNYHDACWTQGLEFAAQQLMIQGCTALALYLQDQGVSTL